MLPPKTSSLLRRTRATLPQAKERVTQPWQDPRAHLSGTAQDYDHRSPCERKEDRDEESPMGPAPSN